MCGSVWEWNPGTIASDLPSMLMRPSCSDCTLSCHLQTGRWLVGLGAAVGREGSPLERDLDLVMMLLVGDCEGVG